MGADLTADDFARLREAYESCTIGRELPSLAITRGAVLNFWLQTDRYDPDSTYVVSAQGIELLHTGVR